MPDKLIRRLIILGGLVIIGIISSQSYWLLKTYDIKDQEFDQTVQKMLLTVAQRISKFNEADLPKKDFIERKASNLYVVNINSNINFDILEDYLYQEMKNFSLETSFDYSVYDCTSKDLVYGNYCRIQDDNEEEIIETNSPPLFVSDSDYYFVVRFPGRESFLLTNMRMTVIFAIIAILAVLFFLYAMWVVMRQKRVSELQKDFINNMTHEFKTPISSIKIASDYFRKDKTVAGDERLSKYADIITEQNQRLNEQVEKVLNIAKLEKDSFELKKEKIQLNDVVESIVNNEKMTISGTINLDQDPNELYINADILHFTNVVSNIIDNGAKYSKEEATIHVKTELKENASILSISDEGIGIRKEHLRNIFDKFYRVSTGDVHDVKGFGLGLFYVKNICDAHGWLLDVKSQIDKGTTFSIKIPNAKK